MQQVGPQPSQSMPVGNLVTMQMPVTAGEKRKTPKNFQKVFYVFGIIEVIIACLCIIFGIVVICLPYRRSYMGGIISYVATAIWCSIPLIANMVMAIITSIFMATATTTGAVAAVVYTIVDYVEYVYIFHGLIAVLTFIGLILTIVHAAFCCCAGVCRKQKYNSYGYVTSTQQVLQIPPVNTMVPAQETKTPFAFSEGGESSIQTSPNPPSYTVQ